MRFSQLDKIRNIELGKSISAVKCLSLSEEYLRDHFPRFPVMPGVLMLEAMFQASMWLVRATENFEKSTVVLREAKSLKFQGFVQPGNSLEIFCQIKSSQQGLTSLKVSGDIDGKTATSGRMVIESYNLAERFGLDQATDDYRRMQFRMRFRNLCDQINSPELLKFARESESV